jgi:hypothetical protein
MRNSGQAKSTISGLGRPGTAIGRLTRGRSTRRGGRSQDHPLEPRAGEHGLESQEPLELADAGLSMPFRDQLRQAAALQEPERLRGDENLLELRIGKIRRQVDQDEINGYAWDRVLDPDVAGIDLAPVDGDRRARSTGTGR